jgi:hypothetical protein
MQGVLIDLVAAPVLVVVVLMIVGPAVAIWDWFKHPFRIGR